MARSSTTIDYYAVLQVHPSADGEVINAAYRQLMKKYHPDVAGDDPAQIAFHHKRATAINEAFNVLGDPAQRQRYDAALNFGVSPPGSAARWPPYAEAPSGPGGGSASNPTPAWAYQAGVAVDQTGAPATPVLAWLVAAYYLLPGRYEWEKGGRAELLRICLVPPLGVAAFALMTGRLAPWIGSSLQTTVLAGVTLLLASLPLWSSLPRLIVAAAPIVLLTGGMLDPYLRQANVPGWLAWMALSLLSLTLSARLYVFGMLPTLGICWLLTQFH